MIIWSRWGILVMAFVGIGIALGFLIKAIAGVQDSRGDTNGVFVGVGFILSAALLWFAVRKLVGTVIDKPKPAVFYEKLAEPTRNADGSVQTHRVLPVVHPETGEQVYTNPVSTLFFIPVRFWPYILGALGVIVLIVNLVGVLAR